MKEIDALRAEVDRLRTEVDRLRRERVALADVSELGRIADEMDEDNAATWAREVRAAAIEIGRLRTAADSVAASPDLVTVDPLVVASGDDVSVSVSIEPALAAMIAQKA